LTTGGGNAPPLTWGAKHPSKTLGKRPAISIRCPGFFLSPEEAQLARGASLRRSAALGDHLGKQSQVGSVDLLHLLIEHATLRRLTPFSRRTIRYEIPESVTAGLLCFVANDGFESPPGDSACEEYSECRFLDNHPTPQIVE
jgi:hypothetical protein